MCSAMFRNLMIISVLFHVNNAAKLVATLDNIQLYANPKYLNASYEITYQNQNHKDYLITVEETFVRDVSNIL